MDDKDRSILEYNNKFIKRVLKSALYTFFILLFTMIGLAFIFDLIFPSGDLSIIISLYISIIFTIIYCTMTIIEEIRKFK